MPLDEVGELFGVELEDEDVETIGGLMAKHLGKVPIPGAEVTCHGLHLEAESLAGRRNKVVTVVVTPEEPVVATGEPAPGQGHEADATA
jgi:CBS domain containing-hemolysin-like protein